MNERTIRLALPESRKRFTHPSIPNSPTSPGGSIVSCRVCHAEETTSRVGASLVCWRFARTVWHMGCKPREVRA